MNMKRYLSSALVMVLVMVGLVAVAQPALAGVRVGISVGLPFPVVVAPVATVSPAPVYYPLRRPVYVRHAVYRPVWVPGHFNRWGVWIAGHWR
jgi:hypothetical protein